MNGLDSYPQAYMKFLRHVGRPLLSRGVLNCIKIIKKQEDLALLTDSASASEVQSFVFDSNIQQCEISLLNVIEASVLKRIPVSGPLHLTLNSPKLQFLSIKLSGSFSLEINNDLEYLSCECQSVCFASSGRINKLELKTESVSAPLCDSSFYFTRSLKVRKLNTMHFKCPFLMVELQILSASLPTSKMVKKLLKMAPNLKSLSLVIPVDSTFDLNFHPKIRVVELQFNIKVELINLGSQMEVKRSTEFE